MEHLAAPHDDTHIVGSVTVTPGQPEQLRVKYLYRLSHKPKFRFDYSTDEPGMVTRTEHKLTDGTVYYPIFDFKNRGSRACTVTVWWIGGGKAVR